MSEEIVLREALKGVWETVHAISNIVWNAKSEPILKIKQLAEKAESELKAALATQSPASSRPARGTEAIMPEREYRPFHINIRGKCARCGQEMSEQQEVYCAVPVQPAPSSEGAGERVKEDLHEPARPQEK